MTVNLISATEPGAMMGDKARRYMNRVLDELGVVRTVGTKVTKVLPDAVHLDNGDTIASDLILWTTGVKVAPLAARAGIATDARGLIVTDATLRSISHPDIHAIGDAALVRQAWGQLHGTCQSGVVTADYTASVIARLLRGKPVRPTRSRSAAPRRSPPSSAATSNCRCSCRRAAARLARRREAQVSRIAVDRTSASRHGRITT